ncbi:hypothetical protein GCM10023224_08350 [Streptomonospora halophila]|uniref:Uncharacterized protein n=1 Tax=Streptomonospora halophila TaxID=427369 RepID=A0ABP9G7E0_9ACTN
MHLPAHAEPRTEPHPGPYEFAEAWVVVGSGEVKARGYGPRNVGILRRFEACPPRVRMVFAIPPAAADRDGA